jgi:hypothetical protein
VGSYTAGANQSLPLTEVWNGLKWKPFAAVNPSGATQAAFNSISCLSASSCIAVGDYTTAPSASTPNLTLAESWNGATWTLLTTSTPSGATAAQLTGVSCASAAMCMAVGGYATAATLPNRTLSEVWNGSSWTTQTTPNPASGSGTLSHVSCPSATDCTAVGSPLTFTPVIEQWSGGTWTLQTAATRAGQFALLGGVSCTAASTCTAVGASGTGQFVAPESLAEGWNGASWTIQTTVNKTGATGTSFASLACTSGTSCVAVGNYLTNASPQRPAAAGWNGTKWALQGAKGSGTRSLLSGISCPAPTTCLAVGSRSSTTAMLPLAEVWNGTSWATQTVPNPSGSTNTQLRSISCPSTTSCVAVGTFSDSTTGHTLALIETWNGTSWTLIKPPEPIGVTYAILTGVSCPSASLCLAAGGYSTSAGAFSPTQLLALRWDGTNWTLQTAATPSGATASTFTGVSCPSATDCEVVGGYTTSATSTFPTTTLAELWNGTTWTIQTSPNPSSGGFTAGSCAGVGACTAVGTSFFAENWDGLTWTTQSLAAPPTQSAQLNGVSCATTTTCTIVGTYQRNFWVAPIFGNSIWVLQIQLPFAEQSS